MARTTLDLDPMVLEQLRDLGGRERKSMGQVASELLAPALAQRGARRAQAAPLSWVSRELGKPLVDLEDKEAMRALLDARP